MIVDGAANHSAPLAKANHPPSRPKKFFDIHDDAFLVVGLFSTRESRSSDGHVMPCPNAMLGTGIAHGF